MIIMVTIHFIMTVIVDLNLSGRCINERNFFIIIQALLQTQMRIESLDLSFNQFFKDQSMNELIGYLEKKAIQIMDAKCKMDIPVLNKLK